MREELASCHSDSNVVGHTRVISTLGLDISSSISSSLAPIRRMTMSYFGRMEVHSLSCHAQALSHPSKGPGGSTAIGLFVELGADISLRCILSRLVTPVSHLYESSQVPVRS